MSDQTRNTEQITPTKKKQLPFYSDKPYSYNWEKPIKSHPFTYKWSIPLAGFILNRSFDSISFYGTENVPPEGPFILAANHVKGTDPIAVAYGFRGNPECYFMAKEEFFHAFYTRWALNIWNGFPVSRGSADRDAMKYAQRIMEGNYGLVIFPQGTRDRENKRPADFKAGAAMVARECKVPVVPVSIRLFPVQKKNKEKLRCVVRYGTPIPYEDLGFTEGSRKSKELRAATQIIEDTIASLWDQGDGSHEL